MLIGHNSRVLAVFKITLNLAIKYEVLLKLQDSPIRKVDGSMKMMIMVNSSCSFWENFGEFFGEKSVNAVKHLKLFKMNG